MALRYGERAAKARAPFRAVAYQPKSDPTRLIAEAHRPAIAAALARALKIARAEVPRAEIARLVQARNLAGAADAVNLQSLRHDLRGVFDAVADTFKASAMRAAGDIRATRAPARKDATTMSGETQRPDRFAFDMLADEVLSDLRDYQDAFIGSLTDDARQAVFDTITQGVRDNAEPAEIADQVRDQIGLSDRLAAAVASYRRALETGSSDALRRALRDAGADADVQSAIDAGAPMSPERIGELVGSYTERALDYRADMIARTESNRAANMGLQASYRQAVADGVFPSVAVKQFWRVALDERTCPICIMIAIGANVGIGIGDSFMSEGEPIDTPPAHPNCLPGDALVLADGVTAASKRWYDGNLVVIRTAGGKEIACTPNHPILTPTGWVAAHLLNKGDDIVCRSRSQGVGDGTDLNRENVPARIEDIAKAFGRSEHVSARPVPTAAEDFHGDGLGSKVAIIWADRLLHSRRNAPCFKHRFQFGFKRRCAELTLHNGPRAFLFLGRRVLTAASRVMGFGDLGRALFGAHAFPFQRLGLALAANGDAGLFEAKPNGASNNAEMLRHADFRNAAFVHGDKSGKVSNSLQETHQSA